jgi:Amt family ammonium transporter
MGGQLYIQTFGVVITFLFALVGSWILLKLVDQLIGLRVDDEQETEGLDLVLHDERGYDL